MAYGVNVGQETAKGLEKWNKGVQNLAAADADYGGVTNAVGAVEGAYAQAPGQLQQTQNQGLFAMQQQAGNMAGVMSGRGGASNAMSSGAGSANAAAMSTGIGSFMNDIAAQRAGLAIQGAQTNLTNQETLQGYKTTAAASQNAVNAQMLDQDYWNKMQGAQKQAIYDEIQSMANTFLLTGNNDQAGYLNAVKQYASTFPPDVQASIMSMAAQEAKAKGGDAAAKQMAPTKAKEIGWVSKLIQKMNGKG